MKRAMLGLGVLTLGAAAWAAPVYRAAAAPAPRPAPRTAAVSAAIDDATIMAIFDAANTWDIETAALGEKKGTTKAIRDLAHQFVRDHRAVRKQGRDLAAKLKLHGHAPKGFALAKDHADAMATLRSSKGAAFDRAFLEHEVSFHKAVIDAVQQTLLPGATAPEVKKLLTDVAPAFQGHMVAAQNLLDRLPKQ